ncbi:DUF6781 family protein [Piscinibacter sp. XHJ-5]|uniref:DUF6781 family protein n=1 Tax=Piscinibacter sp. XHJ-5 TaxID=3037797 RepID=UPI0024534DD7|nr:DUF6781 family protein [Piscinibacter sp. XHJ-5]
MTRSGIDADALIRQLSEATAKQGDAVRESVQQATLKALQGRELTLKSIKDALKVVTQAVSAGAAQNPVASGVDALLAQAVAGMDAAVLRAVEASRRALEQLVEQGVALQDKQLKKAMTDLEKMEDTLFGAIHKAAGDAAGGLQAPWAQALQGFKQDGSATGGAAQNAIQQLTTQSQAALREGRALGQRTAQALLDHYAALASGVLIGMSGAMAGAPGADVGSAAKPSRAKR